MNKSDRTVVRNEAFRTGKFDICERHNERLNEEYFNPNVITERSHLNVHYKTCDGGTYEQTFNKMAADGTVSLRGLPQDPKVFDELVFDVNSDYFERNGGYEYAKTFFEEAYRLAVNEAGGEQYILSAVMHADEKNKALTEKYGHDVYHYHLHVVYIPVVDKEVIWTKRCKDPARVGTVKAVIKQVSHSKKWPRIKTEKGWINSYSLLQDRYYEHMTAVGFDGFERGQRGSTTEHLSVLDYQIQQDKARVAALEETIADKEKAAAVLDEKAVKKQERLANLNEKIAVTKQDAVMFGEIDGMAKVVTFSKNVQLTPADWEKVSELAKEGIRSRSAVSDLKRQLSEAKDDVKRLNGRLREVLDETRVYREAVKLFPLRVKDFLSEVSSLKKVDNIESVYIREVSHKNAVSL